MKRSDPSPLEKIFQPELNLPGWGRGQHLPERGRIKIRIGIGQIYPIEQIEGFNPKLNPLLAFLKIDVLEQAKRPVVGSGTEDNIPSSVAKLKGIRFLKGRPVKPCRGCRVFEVRISYKIRPYHITARTDIRDIARDCNIDRLARSRRRDAVDLPALEGRRY